MSIANEPLNLDGEQKQRRNTVKESAKIKPSGSVGSTSDTKVFSRVTLSCSRGSESYSSEVSDPSCGGGCG